MAQSSRPIYVGLLGGILAALVLAVPLYASPTQVFTSAERARVLAPDTAAVLTVAKVGLWPAPTPGDWAYYLVGALIVAAAGFASTSRREALHRRAGAGFFAGIVAGAVVWLSVGAAAAGAVGHGPIWLSGVSPVGSDQLSALLAEAIVRVVWLVSITLATILGFAALLGALGGALTMRRGEPGPARIVAPATQLRVALSLLLVTTLTLIVEVGVLVLLEERVIEAAARASYQLSLPAAGVTGLPTMLLLVAATGLSWWIWRLVPLNGLGRWHSRGTIAAAGVIMLQIGCSGALVLINPIGVLWPPTAALLAALVLSTVVGLPLALRVWRRGDKGVTHHLVWQDWLDFLALTGLGGATTFMAGIGAAIVSLLLGAIVFIDPLSGTVTGGAGAMPTVSGSIESIYAVSFTVGLASTLYGLALLPVFVSYEGLLLAYGRLREWWIWVAGSLAGLATGALVGGIVGAVFYLGFNALQSVVGDPEWLRSSFSRNLVSSVALGAVPVLGLVGLVGGQGVALGLEVRRLRRWAWGTAASGTLCALALGQTLPVPDVDPSLVFLPLALAACAILLTQWLALRGAYSWAGWWPVVNPVCAVLGLVVGYGGLVAGGGFPPASFLGLPLFLVLSPAVYSAATGAFLISRGALNESLREDLATWWSRASIRQKVLLFPGVFVLLSLLASLIGYQIGSTRTRQSLINEQLDQDSARMRTAIDQRDSALRDSVTELADPLILRAAATPSDAAAVRAAGERANELRVRYQLTQVIVTAGDGQPVLSLAEPDSVRPGQSWARLDTGRPEHMALLTCPPAGKVRLEYVPQIDDTKAGGASGSSLPQVDANGLVAGANYGKPLLIACLPLAGGAAAVYSLLDPEYARAGVEQQANLQSGLSFTFDPPRGAGENGVNVGDLSGAGLGQSVGRRLTLGAPMRATLYASTGRIDQIIGGGFRTMLLASLLTLAALLIFGRWLAHSFTRSVIGLTDAARAVSAGDLGVQVPVTSRDEIGDLAGAFNTMVAGLRDREAAVKQREAAEAANRAKSMFLANMSHELRTPLNAILGFTQLLLRDRSLSTDQRESLQVIGRSGEHLLALINDVLEMSKIEAGRVELREERFDLLRLLQDMDEMFQVRAAEKGLQLLLEAAPEVPRFVRTDKGKLRQILINLIGNAVKFTTEGGVTLRVGLREDVDGNIRPRLLWEIEDTGPGMAPEELSAIFQAFMQTASGRHTQEGTGLGLAISRQFVDLMGGELTVSSQLGQGSIFGFSLPVEVVDSADETAAPADRILGLGPGQPEFRILIVEDKWYNRHLLIKLLTSLGFSVREAANGEEGVAAWHEWQPHLIFMDMRMPVMDGYEATRQIKGTERGRSTVIIALTASAFEDERSRVAEVGCDGFIRKPFRNDQLFAALEHHLGARFERERGSADMVAAVATPAHLADLSVLPPETLAALHTAAEQADAEAVEQTIAPFAAQHPDLARDVANLLENFRFDLLMQAAAVAGKGIR